MTIRTIRTDGVVKVEYNGVLYAEDELHEVILQLDEDIRLGLPGHVLASAQRRVKEMKNALAALRNAKRDAELEAFEDVDAPFCSDAFCARHGSGGRGRWVISASIMYQGDEFLGECLRRIEALRFEKQEACHSGSFHSDRRGNRDLDPAALQCGLQRRA